MPALIVIVLIILTLVFGKLWLDRQRKAAATERERRVKEAAGVFDDATEDTKGAKSKKKKRRWRLFSSDKRHKLTERDLAILRDRFAVRVDLVLRARRKFVSQIETCQRLERANQSCRNSGVLQDNRLSADLRSSELQSAVDDYLKAGADLAQKSLDWRTAYDTMLADAARYRSMYEQLKSELNELRDWNADALEDEAALVFARNVEEQASRDELLPSRNTVGDVVLGKTSLTPAPSVEPRPAEANADYDALIEGVRQAVLEVMRADHSVSQNHSEVSRQFAAWSNWRLSAASHVHQPRFPTEQEVQEMIGSAQRWVEQEKTERERLRAMLLALTELHMVHLNSVNALNRALQALSEGEQRLRRARKSRDREPSSRPAWDWRGDAPPAPKKEAAPAAANSKTFVLPDKFWLTRVHEPSWDPHIIEASKHDLNASQSAAEGSFLQVRNVLSGRLHTLRSEHSRWTQELPALVGEQAPIGLEKELAQIASGMRKFGFACAQWHVANLKLRELDNEPALQIDISAPDWRQSNVETFVRNHRDWTRAVQQADQERQRRAEQVGRANAYAEERRQQAIESFVGLQQSCDRARARLEGNPHAELEDSCHAVSGLASLCPYNPAAAG